jgi:phosphopantothenate-cysteine ligase/phosphopantothenoylcysteine decarboxylase/phosphopantothenate--cysteine ligase
MQILVTAGNTQAPIDRVRCITNIFTGRTGTAIATRAAERGHAVTLFTSHPDIVGERSSRLAVCTYRTFDDLRLLMAKDIPGGPFDAVVHCAAVSDYLSAGVFAKHHEITISSSGKLKSDARELWLKLVRAPKLIDAVRTEWGFRGIVVKFKLEVGVEEKKLLEIAEVSRRASGADVMVANTLDGMADWAYLGPLAGNYERIVRAELADRLIDVIEDAREAR